MHRFISNNQPPGHKSYIAVTMQSPLFGQFVCVPQASLACQVDGDLVPNGAFFSLKVEFDMQLCTATAALDRIPSVSGVIGVIGEEWSSDLYYGSTAGYMFKRRTNVDCNFVDVVAVDSPMVAVHPCYSATSGRVRV